MKNMNSKENRGQQEIDSKLLNRDALLNIVEQIREFCSEEGRTDVVIRAWWRGELRWARNRINLASGRRDYTIVMKRSLEAAGAEGKTNQIDRTGLEDLKIRVDRIIPFMGKQVGRPNIAIDADELDYPNTRIWSDASYNLLAEKRAEIANQLTVGAENKGMISAGYLEVRASEQMTFSFGRDHVQPEYPRTDLKNIQRDMLLSDNLDGSIRSLIKVDNYTRHTQAQCSMTVRHPKGIGSGWAGHSSFDWTKIDGSILADRALSKCLQSLNPVAIEPGRYTVILEPQAVCELFSPLLIHLKRQFAESGGVFFLGFDSGIQKGRSKLGLKVADERITIRQAPLHPEQGVLPKYGLKEITWIDKGVLTELHYDQTYSLMNLNEIDPELDRPAFQIDGGDSTVEDMISTTKRGIIVTRFSNLTIVDLMSLLLTGITRDGLWLIENGKITKAIRNMRFTDSPAFVMNQIEQIGVVQPVFFPRIYGLSPVFTPAIKSNDFAFTSTADAI